MAENVKAIIRARPFNQKEADMGSSPCVEINQRNREVILTNPREPENQKIFRFDGVYDEKSTQAEIYEETVFPLVESASDGYNCTVFAYGQVKNIKCEKLLNESGMGLVLGKIEGRFEFQ